MFPRLRPAAGTGIGIRPVTVLVTPPAITLVVIPVATTQVTRTVTIRRIHIATIQPIRTVTTQRIITAIVRSITAAIRHGVTALHQFNRQLFPNPSPVTGTAQRRATSNRFLLHATLRTSMSPFPRMPRFT